MLGSSPDTSSEAWTVAAQQYLEQYSLPPGWRLPTQ